MRLKSVLVLGIVALSWASTAAAERGVDGNDARGYVPLTRIAQNLQAVLDASASSTRAKLRASGHLVTLTRNWAQILVDGRPVVLDAPVRVRRGVWLVPDTFVARVLPRLTSVPSASPRLSLKTTTTAASRPSAVVESTLKDVRFRSYPSFTRVVLETSAPVGYRVESRGPREARIRLLAFESEARTDDVRDGFIDSLRVERAGVDTMLAVLFEGQGGDVRTTTLADPPRLVIDFMRPTEGERSDRGQERSKLRLIVLDAGHGGHDSGALGPTGLAEKEVVLDVTRRVARLVEERLGVKTRLSRDSDDFVTLRDRTSFANREHADLFVSIHANAHREIANEGVEIYFLSSEATDSRARQVAALENDAVKLEKPTARGKHDIVRSILWDLAQSEFQVESSRLAEVVLDSMTRALRIPNRGVKQAGFYVLGGAAMPAILVEIGFVTNPKEEKKLRDPGYRDEVARAIADGLAEYKRQSEPRVRTTVRASGR